MTIITINKTVIVFPVIFSCFLYFFVQVQNHETLVPDHLLLDIDDLKITGVSDLARSSLFISSVVSGLRIFLGMVTENYGRAWTRPASLLLEPNLWRAKFDLENLGHKKTAC